MPRKTLADIQAEHVDAIAQLQAALATERDKVRTLESRMYHNNQERQAADQRAVEMRGLLDDVKERLAFSEAEVQRMGGYISRVQEDDVVRDPLVQVGDPDGEQQLVPKRRPTHFHHLQSCGEGGHKSHAMEFLASAGCATDRPQRPRHWVRY